MAAWLAVGASLLASASRQSDGDLARVDHLKDFHLETVLQRAGVAACRIATPGDEAWRRLGRALQEQLAKKAGVPMEMVDASAIGEKDYADRNLILLGNLGNNTVIQALYARHYCFTDSYYPGQGGYEVRTIHNPMGWGVNFVLLGASDLAGAEEAVRRFCALLDDRRVISVTDNGKTVQLSRINESRSVHNHEESNEDEYYREMMARLKGALDAGNVQTAMNDVSDVGMCYYQTGREVYGRVFREMMLHYCDLAEPTHDWVLIKKFGGDSDRYFYPLHLIPAWELVETGGVFNDADRLRITNLMLNITHWATGLGYFDIHSSVGKRYSVPGEIRNNHATFAASSLLAGLEYFRKYYPEIKDLQGSYKAVGNIFDGQRHSYRPDDNSATYFNYAPNHFLNYLFTRQDWTYMEQGYLRKIADLIIMAADNRADMSTYGDEIEYKIGYEKGLPLLAKAAWYYKDGEYLWARDWLLRRSTTASRPKLAESTHFNERRDHEGKTDFLYDGWYDGPYNVELERVEPDRLLGIKAMRMDEGLYSFAKKYGNGTPVPIGQAFDKMSFRRDFSPQSEYMLMGGFSGALAHSHEDGNAIVRLTWKDRLWLADMHYRRRLVSSHNSLLVLKDWRYDNIPTFTSLDSQVDFAGTGFTSTSVAGYNGVDWDRNIIWSKGKYLLFIDNIAVKEKDDYYFSLNWRTLGETAFQANALEIRQDGESFNIKSADDSRKIFSEELSDGRFVEWRPYEHTHDGTVKIMAQTQDRAFDKGERLAYINLLYPGAKEDYSVRQIQPRIAEVFAGKTAESIVGLAAEGCRVGALDVAAKIFRLSRTEIELVGGTRLSAAQPLFESSAPVSLRLELATGTGSVGVDREAAVGLRAEQIWIDGQPAALRPGSSAGLKTVSLPAGVHNVRLEPSPAWAALRGELDVPHAGVSAPVGHANDPDSGLAVRWRRSAVKTAEVADIDGDGQPEFIAATGDRVVALSATGQEKWSHRVTGDVRSLYIRDLDGDGKAEIAVGTERGFVHLLDGKGVEKWQYKCAFRPGPITALTAANLDGGGRLELLAGTQGYVLYAFESDGRLRWYNMIDLPWPSAVNILAKDFDGDGKAEIFVASGADHGSVMLSGEGRKLWNLGGTINLATAINFTGKQPDRMIVGGPLQGAVRLVKTGDGSVVWNARIDDDAVAIIPLAPTGEEKGEVLTAYAASGLWVLDGQGNRRRVRSFPSMVNAVIAIADDPGEFAVGCEDGSVVVVDREGKTRARLTLDGPVTAVRSFKNGQKTGLFAIARNGSASEMEFTGEK